jgi:hypothetical protein
VPKNLGPGRRIVSRTAREGVSRFAGQAGTQAPDPTPTPPQNRVSRAGRPYPHPPCRLGIRQFSMADRNIGAQIMRLCVEFRVSGWPFIPRIARGRGVRWRPQRWHQVGLHEGACCCDDHCPGRGDKFGHRVICGATQATGRVRCQGHGDGNRDDRGDRGLPGDRDPAAAGSPDRLRHRQGVFTRHGRLQL